MSGVRVLLLAVSDSDALLDYFGAFSLENINY